MFLILCASCILNVLTVNTFEVLSINDGYKGVIEEIKSKVYLPSAPIAEQWIVQRVDHFNKSDERTWKMMYYEKLNFWKTNGPVYLFINGEAAAAPTFLETGIMYELAKESAGAMYLSEHRYYGKSQPLSRSHFNVEKFKFLSTEQAMADIATLLKTIKKNPLYKNSKVVILGGSYAGNLAAWMKLIYPDLVDAAISSSGPVLAKRDFYEYLEVVGKDYKKFGSSACLENVSQRFLIYDTLLQTDDGINKLKKEMHVCESTDMTKSENIQVFFLAQSLPFILNAQYGTPKQIKDHCTELNNFQNALRLSDKQYCWDEEKSCFDYDFNTLVQEYLKPDNDDMLCWTYQTCTEFGYFQSGTSNDQPFTHNILVEWYDNFCTALFGPVFDKDFINKGVKKVNEMYGGKSINVTNVVFVNGEMDPWSTLGKVTGGTHAAPVVYIPRSSHCKDLFSNEEGDEEEIKLARARIKKQIKKWIEAG